MKEKILSFLKTNAKLAGVQENYLLGVADFYAKTITDEAAIATTFNDGVIDLLKLNAGILQQEGDRRATEASKTAVNTFREKHKLDENGKPIEGKPPKGKEDKTDPDEPAWFTKYKKEQEELVSGLTNKLTQQEKEKTAAALTDKVKNHDKLKGIPQSFLKGRNLIPESEDKIDQLVAELETDWNTFKQEQAEQGVVISVPAAGDGKTPEDGTLGKKLAEKKNANASEGVQGRKV